MFDDLKLIRALSPNELKKFGEEERRASYTDLSRYRDDPVMESTGGWFGGNGKVRADGQSVPLPDGVAKGKRIRNHGLLSKAQRTLDIAGWSPAAQTDVEIFRLVDTEGLTPLLTLLNEATLQRGAETAAAASDEAAASRRGQLNPAKE